MTARGRTPREIVLALMLALTFSTGVIDAVGYLGLDRVFTGNMTGNVVILGMALTGANDLPVLGPLLALGGFMVGAAVAGLVLRGATSGAWTRRTTGLLLATAVLLLAAAALVGLLDHGLVLEAVATIALALAMGVQAATARHLAVKDVTTVVVTSTLTGLSADFGLGLGAGQQWRRRAGAVALIGAGAAAGAALLTVHLATGMLLSVLVTIVVAVVGHRTARVPPTNPLEPGRGGRYAGRSASVS